MDRPPHDTVVDAADRHAFDALADVGSAVGDEISAVRSAPSRAFSIIDGRRLARTPDGWMYIFGTERLIPLQRETRVQIKTAVREDQVSGVLIDREEFRVFLELADDIGESVGAADLSADPGFILNMLVARLRALQTDEAGLLWARRLLGMEQPTEQTERRGNHRWHTDREAPHGLNTEQSLAVVRCTDASLHFVWGPPGTGKTRTLAQAVRALVLAGERVLVVAATNAAVDRAMVSIASALEDTEFLADGRVLRYGPPVLPDAQQQKSILPEALVERACPDLMNRRREFDRQRRELLEAVDNPRGGGNQASLDPDLRESRRRAQRMSEELSQAIRALVARASVLGTTLARLVVDEDVIGWPADAVVVDEAGSASFPYVMVAASPDAAGVGSCSVHA